MYLDFKTIMYTKGVSFTHGQNGNTLVVYTLYNNPYTRFKQVLITSYVITIF